MSNIAIKRNLATLITRVECEQILANAFGDKQEQVALQDFTVENAEDAIGFLGEYFRLTLNYFVLHSNSHNHSGSENSALSTNDAFKHLKVFIKALPIDSTESAKEAIFEKEANLYATLLKELQQCSTIIWCPKSYYTRDDLFVMQDLKELGYQPCANMDESLTDSEMKQILNGLAALHAASIIYEEQRQLNIEDHYHNMLQEITVAPNVAWYTTGLRAIVAIAQQHHKYQSETAQHFINTKLEHELETIYDMMNPSVKYRNVLCHRDPWRGNIFFQNPHCVQNTAILVDYQTCRYCPPAIDVIFTIFMNLSSQCRQQNEMAYINWYYQQFSQRLSDFCLDAEQQMTVQTLLQSYEEFKIFAFVYKAIAATILKVPKEFVTNDYKFIDRTKKVLDYMQDNAIFRNYMEECVEEMLNAVLSE